MRETFALVLRKSSGNGPIYLLALECVLYRVCTQRPLFSEMLVGYCFDHDIFGENDKLL